ncbi:MAG TPA: PilN domain-containing protein [Azospirillaceae bacterium]|nr:PilN domain-containing protein [Azospirillaceae bacterium]
MTAVTPTVAPLRAEALRWARWWWGEMGRLLPSRLRGAGSGTLVALPAAGGAFDLVRRTPEGMLPAGRLDPGRAGGGRPDPLPAEALLLSVASPRLLRRSFPLPAAAAARLREVVALELERRTPLRADQALFAAEAAGASEDGRILEVRVALLPRAAVQEALDGLARLGLAPAAVEAVEPDGTATLLPLGPGAPGSLPRPGRRLAAGLLALALLLLAPLAVRAVELAWLRREAAALAAETVGARAAVEAVEAMRVRAFHAVEAKRAAPSALVALEALSRLLPDGTWLTEIRIEGATIELIGLTRDSAGLVPLLEGSPHLEGVQSRAALVRDPAGLDRFHLAARLVPHAAP